MKIVHICLGNYFVDNYSYQENLLTEFHKKLGYDVEVIASLFSFDKNGKETDLPEAKQYTNEDGVKVTRLNYRKPKKLYRKLRRFDGFREALENSKPDIIFTHNCQFLDIDILADYAKKHNVTVYVDNHADFSNSAKNWLSRNILHGIIWKRCAHIIEPYTKKFYGVLPARVDFLKDVYRLPPEKCELLVMGADDELAEKAAKPETIQRVKEQYQINDDFLVVTGGKINSDRPEVLNLMRAVSEIDGVRLLVFGTVSKELEKEFDAVMEGSSNISFVGWKNARETYELMAAGDLIVFPGLHSVMWEQAVALGVPCIFRDMEGFHHVDVGGNAVFLKDVSKDSLKEAINFLKNDPQKCTTMRTAAQENGMKTFSYKNIARRSIQAL